MFKKNNEWIKELKVGDEVFYYNRNCFGKNMRKTKVKSISAKKGIITLENNEKFYPCGEVYGKGYTSDTYELYQINEESISMFKNIQAKNKGINLMYHITREPKLQEKISTEDYETIIEILEKYKE